MELDREKDDRLLRRVGLKVTHPRVKILQLLANEKEPRHLTAEAIYHLLRDAGEDVGLATVYRVLTQFEEAGLVHRHHFDAGQAIFELVRDDHHDHIVCVDCGRVVEFTDALIEKQQISVAKKLGFQLQDHSLYLYGACVDKSCPHRKK